MSHPKVETMGGGPTTKKIMPPGKIQDVLCLSCSFLFFSKTPSKSTFLCRIWSKMCPQKRTKKIMIFVFLIFFVLFCCLCRILLRKCPQTENKKDHAAGKIARCPLSFLVFCCWTPPPPTINSHLSIDSNFYGVTRHIP